MAAGPIVLMPAATADELSGAGAGGRILDHRHDVRPARGGGQIELQRRVANPQEVPVPLDEPRNRQAAFEVDDLRLVADVAVELDRAADRHNAVAADRQGLRLRDQIVHGDDRPVAQHQVGMLDRRRSAARRSGDGDQTGNHAPEPRHGVSRVHGPKLTAARRGRTHAVC